MTRQLTFLTLGPAGTNHELVTRRYLACHGVPARVDLIEDFFCGLAQIKSGVADYMVQAAVHRDCADVVARGHFEFDVHVVDTFISPSKELAILTRSEVSVPWTLALQPSTRAYADLSAWSEHVSVGSIMEVAEGLLDGRYDSGLTTSELGADHPDRFRVETKIGTVDDPWIVLGRTRVAENGLVCWPESPGARRIRSYVCK
ncbi:MAG: hypothetical protein AAFX00_06025 [Pseudomonadota bacterium]